MPVLPAPEPAGDGLLLRGVTVPAAVLDPALRASAAAEARYDLRLQDGRIAALVPAADARARGGLLLPPLADLHVHLDKTATVQRGAPPAAGLMDAIAQTTADRARWSAEDIEARAEWALHQAWRQGTAAMRTHVDWRDQTPLAWEVLGRLAQRWRGRVELQRASLSALETLADPERGPRIARRVAEDGEVLGAFVPPVADDLGAAVDAVCALAARFGLALDFHVDEGLEPAARGFDAVLAGTLRHGLEGRVLCGHACALATRPPADVAPLLRHAAEAGVALVTLPLTNLYLQDRDAQRSPRQRGLAPVREALAAGMAVAVASDNVGDAFHPYGDYDLLDALRLAIRGAHLDDALAACWALVGPTPARLLRPGTDGLLRVGAPADFLRLDVDSSHDWMARAQCAREVWRGGRPLAVDAAPWPRNEG